jgi:large subunit ribosomal protein L13
MKENTTITATIIDATGKSLGRLATEVSSILLAKNSASFAKNFTAKVKVEVINASKVKITGDKLKQKTHKRFSLYPGGLKTPSWADVSAKKGYGELLRHAVEGMLPKNSLQKERMKNLKISE